MYYIVYVSSASKGFSEEELKKLSSVCQQHNNALHITGLLLFMEGNFIQVLEGEKEDVTGLYRKICEDASHHGIFKIIEGEMESRVFSKWSMGFYPVTSIRKEEIPGFTDITSDEFINYLFCETHPSVKLLKSFYSMAQPYRFLAA